MSAIEFRTLGTLDLRAADGRELHSLLAQPKRIALLAYLCVAEPHGYHRRDTLLGLFWPDSDQEHARTSLRKSLHLLRRALGDEAILSRGDEEVAVDLDRIKCDVVLFDDLVTRGQPKEALPLYRGDLLTGFFVDDCPEFEQWLQSARVKLRSLAATTALELASQLEESGDVPGAIKATRRSIELADSDERPLRKLMELQAIAGDSTGAVRAYDAFARHLAAEYQTAPSAETRSLADQIRASRETVPRDAGTTPLLGKDDVPPIAPRGSPAIAGHSGGRERIALYSVVPIAVLVSGVAIWGWMRPAAAKPVARYALVVDSSEAIAKSKSAAGRLALSPDGSLLAYIGGREKRLLVRPRNQLRAAPVPETDGVVTPFFSPDGGKVGFLREFKVEIAFVDGGSPIVVSDTLTGVAGASWGSDGFIYVDGAGWTGLLRVEPKAGAKPRWFTVLDTAGGEFDHTWPDVLPNGKGVLFTVSFKGTDGVNNKTSFAIAVADIATGKHHVIVPNAMFARYSSSGHLLYITPNKTLMIVPFDQASMKVTGKPAVLMEGMRLSFFGSADLAVSATGTLLYATGPGEGTYEVVWVTRTGETKLLDPDLKAGVFVGFPIISPDGKQLALSMVPTTAALSIWIKRLAGGPAFRLTIDTANNVAPTWTPDGRSVTYSSDAGGGAWRLWTKRADGSSPAVLQAHEARNLFASHWSPDGKWLVFQSAPEQKGAGDILGMRPGIDSAPVPLIATNFSELAPAISPDGRWLAYESDETGQYEVYVVPFPKMGPGKWAISGAGGTEPLWSHTGKELFYRDGAGNLRAVKVKSKPTFSTVSSTILFPAADFYAYPNAPQYAVSPDDQRFVMVRTVGATTPDKLIVVDNWFEELRGKGGHK